jgi:inosine-uridine nucleoside N-ribohydrolase
VKNLPPINHPVVRKWHDQHGAEGATVVEALKNMVESRLNEDGSVRETVSVVITGPCTNVAAFKRKYPELYESGVIDRAVVMGGAFDVPQWTPYAGESCVRVVLGIDADISLFHMRFRI